ncbi:tetratricopeptide repeat protein [Streptomyces violascens]|uniref:tetratricopeptide repeat protein n=1 Tax=Streptomyces violascens TaxID=67381 RepID=UPI00167795F0|nr:tetratricopeptide repeat protein [Streptomyces violascens]GGU40996.1 hypothetical protein GCM10010289_72370 [Streptomyces violascens]
MLQRAVRDTLTPDQYRHLARTAADALSAAWPPFARDIPLSAALRDNTAALTSCAEPEVHHTEVHPVLYQAGRSLLHRDQAAEAREYFQRLLTTTTRYLGPDHPDTLVIRRDLALWRGEAGDADGAVAALEELLTDVLRVGGPDDRLVPVIRSHLAYWQECAGYKTGEAATLADQVRMLGAEHPGTQTPQRRLVYREGRLEAYGKKPRAGDADP